MLNLQATQSPLTSPVFEGTVMFSFSNIFFLFTHQFNFAFLKTQVLHILLPIFLWDLLADCPATWSHLSDTILLSSLNCGSRLTGVLHSELLGYLHQDIFFRLTGDFAA